MKSILLFTFTCLFLSACHKDAPGKLLRKVAGDYDWKGSLTTQYQGPTNQEDLQFGIRIKSSGVIQLYHNNTLELEGTIGSISGQDGHYTFTGNFGYEVYHRFDCQGTTIKSESYPFDAFYNEFEKQ